MKFLTKNNDLTVEPEGAEKVWSLRRRISLNRRQVEKIVWHDSFREWSKGEIRLGRTAMPGVLIAGNFWSAAGGWDYLYLKRPHGFWYPSAENVIELRLKDHFYKRILVTSSLTEFERLKGWLA